MADQLWLMTRIQEEEVRNNYMLGPVSAWMGDHLWTGKPPQCGTRHPSLLSLSLPYVQAGMSTWRKLGE